MSSGPLFRLSEVDGKGVSLLGFWELLPPFLSLVTLAELYTSALCLISWSLGKGPGILSNSPDVPLTLSQTECQGERVQGTGSPPQWLLSQQLQSGHTDWLGFWCPCSLWAVTSPCPGLPDPI